MSEIQTAAEWLEGLTTQLADADIMFGHGQVDARQEAYAIVCFVCQLAGDGNPDDLKFIPTPAQIDEGEALLQRRIQTQQPLAYLTQQAWFMQRPFYVDARVLIPRSPIGEWLQMSMSPWLNADDVLSVLDIGTGSGCLAIGAAWAFPKASVHAVDVSSDALDVARINVSHYQLDDRVALFQSDVYATLPLQRYDLIIANPPYVSDSEWQELPAEYHHEPRSALVARHAGMSVVHRILSGCTSRLSDKGVFLLEVGYSRKALVAQYPSVPWIWLDCAAGGEGLALLTADLCRQHAEALSNPIVTEDV